MAVDDPDADRSAEADSATVAATAVAVALPDAPRSAPDSDSVVATADAEPSDDIDPDALATFPAMDPYRRMVSVSAVGWVIKSTVLSLTPLSCAVASPLAERSAETVDSVAAVAVALPDELSAAAPSAARPSIEP